MASFELNGPSLRAALLRVQRQGIAAARTGLIATGDAIARQARANASNGRHPYGTPTPARPGTGPAIISRTLVNSITRTASVRTAAGWELKVGLAPGRYPPYSGRTPSSRYGLFLETGLRNGATYPFLLPAARMAGIQAAIAFGKAFAAAHWESPDS